MTQAVKAADSVVRSSTSAAAAATSAPAASAPAASAPTVDVDAGGPHETVTDTSVVAMVIGINEAKLITALNSGQTPADVAKANNVDVQVVIDALVKDGEQALAAQVTAGTLTQAEADAQKAAVLQRSTDQANGALNVGGGRHEPDADDQGTPSSSPSTNG